MAIRVPKEVAKPFLPAAKQKWFTYKCETCDIYFKIDCHEKDRKRLDKTHCPLCGGVVQRKGGME